MGCDQAKWSQTYSAAQVRGVIGQVVSDLQCSSGMKMKGYGTHEPLRLSQRYTYGGIPVMIGSLQMSG